MKRTFAKSGLQMLLALVLMVGGVLLTATNASAQGLTMIPAGSTAINWNTEAVATNKVTQRIGTLHTTALANNPVGSQAYVDAYREVVFYKAVYLALNYGFSTGAAVNFGLKTVNMKDAEPDLQFSYSANKPQLAALFNTAKNYLTN